jgi:hypothetical protein
MQKEERKEKETCSSSCAEELAAFDDSVKLISGCVTPHRVWTEIYQSDTSKVTNQPGGSVKVVSDNKDELIVELINKLDDANNMIYDLKHKNVSLHLLIDEKMKDISGLVLDTSWTNNLPEHKLNKVK